MRVRCALNGLLRHPAVLAGALVFHAPASEMHQNLVDRQPVQPRRKRRIAAKTADLAKKLDKNFLREVFGLGLAAGHPQAEAVSAAVIPLVDQLKSREITASRQTAKINIGSRGIESFFSRR